MPEAVRAAVILPLPCSADFADRCAQHIVECCRPRLPDLSALTVVIPSPALGPDVRKALAAAAGTTLLMPRLATLNQLVAHDKAASQPDSLRQLRLYRLLRARGWFADGALWEICAELIALFEELSERAIGLPEDEAALVARLEQAYDAYGSAPLRFEAEVVHRLWRAEASGSPGRHAAMSLALTHLAEQGAAPLFMLCEGEPRPVEMAFCRTWAGRHDVTIFLPERDVAASPLMGVLNAAWPTGAEGAQPLARRADAARAHLPESPLAGRLHLIGAASLEEEAAVVVAEVRRWLAMGRKRIALVACDRMAARRARALLERDGILMQDETGWKLATTRAAALLDAWLEVVSADAYHRDLLDLVKSPFVFDELTEEARQSALMQLEDGLARHNLVYGLARYEAVLAREGGHAEAVGMLRQVEAARRRMPRVRASVADWLSGLEQALGELGALPRLARDEAGATLLELLRTRRDELSAVPERLTFGEWREWLNRELEEAAFIDRGIESPLVMTHLAATRLRRFDAAILIGADRDNLAPAFARAIFSSPAVRSDLGLSMPAEAVARLRDDLAGLIAFSSEVTATWQVFRGDEANLLCAELSLLSVLHMRAWGDDLVDTPPAALSFPVGAGTTMPRPAAPLRVPLRLSPSAYISLMACPYQFYARRMLGLAEAEEVREALEKRDYGEHVHRILQRFHETHAQLSGLPDEVLEAVLVAISRDVFAPVIEDNFLNHAWLARWLECVPGYIAWQKGREAAGWRYAGGELVRERIMPLAGGGDLLLQGRLDRLDRRSDGSEAVLDYKTQDAQALKRRLADPSEDVQLACYALLQGVQVDEACYVALQGGKPVQLDMPEVQALACKQEARLIAAIEALRAGAALPAHGIDAACAWCEARGLCRRDYHAEAATP